MKKQLTVGQRYTISVLLSQKMEQKEIAKSIGVHKSTISREISRNKKQHNGLYDSDLAQRKAERRRAERRRRCDCPPQVWQRAKDLLEQEFSPEQIAGRCRLEGELMVSHETIYKRIWANKKQGGDLHTHLRRKGRKYRHRGAKKDSRGIIKNRVSISERPDIVDDKSRFGDLEIDTIIGKNHKGAIVTINDRKSGILWMQRLDSKEAIPLMIKTIEALKPYKDRLFTITSDNGKEFARHEKIAKALGIKFYFCRPYHSWERGANENTNGLIRQYLPKKTSFENITDDQIKMIQDKLNNRPRKRLGYMTPNEKFIQIITQNPVALTS